MTRSDDAALRDELAIGECEWAPSQQEWHRHVLLRELDAYAAARRPKPRRRGKGFGEGSEPRRRHTPPPPPSPRRDPLAAYVSRSPALSVCIAALRRTKGDW